MLIPPLDARGCALRRVATAVFFAGVTGLAAPSAAQPATPLAGASATVDLQASTSALRAAIDAAWMRQPQARAAEQRRAELDARERAAEGLTRDAPAVTVENWSDRWSQREGFAKYAGEFAFPLWLPGERERTKDSIAAERAYFEAVVAATRLRVAGEVREAYWATRLAEADLAVATLRYEEAKALVDDVARRLRAGVVARLDVQTAQSQVHLAESALAVAQSAWLRAGRAFEQLTGLKELPPFDGERVGAVNADALHPALLAVTGAVEAARMNLKLVAATGRDRPELGVGMFNERSLATDPSKNVVTLRLRIPLATEQRNAPRIAAANATLMETEAMADLERARVEADIGNAQRDLQTSEQVLRLARARQGLAADNRRLTARSFDLGESDLPTRLRAQNEFLDAELAVRRAQAEQRRAIARLNQSLGLQP